jgi:hypothetical protein
MLVPPTRCRKRHTTVGGVLISSKFLKMGMWVNRCSSTSSVVSACCAQSMGSRRSSSRSGRESLTNTTRRWRRVGKLSCVCPPLNVWPKPSASRFGNYLGRTSLRPRCLHGLPQLDPARPENALARSRCARVTALLGAATARANSTPAVTSFTRVKGTTDFCPPLFAGTHVIVSCTDTTCGRSQAASRKQINRKRRFIRLLTAPDIAGTVASLTDGRTGRAGLKQTRQTTPLR